MLISINNLIEKEIITSFVQSNRQDRILYELSALKKRKNVFWHFASDKIFVPSYVKPCEFYGWDSLQKTFCSLTNDKFVYIIGESCIGAVVLDQAMNMLKNGDICLVYFGKGNGFFQGEPDPVKQPRFFLVNNKL